MVSVILILYFPVSAGGYFVYGEDVTINIAMALTRTSLVTIANILMAIHLVLAFLIVINPVCQELEEHFQLPQRMYWQCSPIRLETHLRVMEHMNVPLSGYNYT